MTNSKIDYTQVFESLLHDRFHYLARHINPEASQKTLESFIRHFELRIAAHPASAPICEETAEFGLTRYHDYVDPKQQLRIIYRINDTDDGVLGMLLLSTRQSIRDALLRYCLRKE